MPDMSVAEFKGLVVRIDPGPRDIAALTEVLRIGKRIGNESLDGDEHLNELIPKPWGSEYRIFAYDFLDCWHLSIMPGHSTSTHVHPRKVTYLLGLGGGGVMRTLDEDVPVAEGSVVRIAAGVFHSTRSDDTTALHLAEIEVPRNKFDLIRLRDGYNRDRDGYESSHSSLADLPARPVPYLPGARMRTSSPDGTYQFGIRAGTDIFYRRRAQDIFHIPLGISGVIAGDLQIINCSQEYWRVPAMDQYYLSLARSH